MNNRLNIQLPHGLDLFVRSKVLGGRYTSASEVVRDALRLMEDRDQILAQYQDQVWNHIAEGLRTLCDAPMQERELLLDAVEIQLEQLETHLTEAGAGVDLPARLPREKLALTVSSVPRRAENTEADGALFDLSALSFMTGAPSPLP